MWYNTARYAEKHMLCRYVHGGQILNRQYVLIKCADLQIESHYSIILFEPRSGHIVLMTLMLFQWTTDVSSGCTMFTGTSAATPLAAGAIALLLHAK